MKNRAVELLFRTQFNIPDDVVVNVMCTSSDDEFYAFYVEWSEPGTDAWKASYCKLPHLVVTGDCE